MPSDDATSTWARGQPNFMKYQRPILELFESALPTLKEESRQCIQNLLDYRATRTRAQFPRSQSAAVLVPLFVGRSGDLYVLLSRRSEALRAYAGDTALPGGKIDPQDGTVEDTARREAFEEIGLPQDRERVPLLCVMEPHLAGNQMIVTPVVVLVLDKTLQPNLNSSEVASIFSQPLASFLSSAPHFSGSRAADPSHLYHTFTDQPWSEGGTVRLHKFLTGREAEGVKPVFGLTASVLIHTATIGYGRTPEFEVQPPNAPTSAQQIAHALLTPSNPLRVACERESVDANKTAARMLRPPMALNATRTIEWEKIGTDWKRLMEGGGDTDAAAKGFGGKGQGKGSMGGFGRGSSGGEGLQKRIDEIKRRVQERVDGGGEGEDNDNEGLGAKIEEFRKRALERKSQGEEDGEERKERGEAPSDGIPEIAKLGEYLDKTRDMVNERMKEVSGDEKKLAKARKSYPKIMEEVKKQLEKMRMENGELDAESLLAKISKEAREGMGNGINAGMEGVRKGKGGGEGCEGRDEGMEKGKEGTRRGLEQVRKYVGKGGDGQNPEQSFPKKRDAKL